MSFLPRLGHDPLYSWPSNRPGSPVRSGDQVEVGADAAVVSTDQTSRPERAPAVLHRHPAATPWADRQDDGLGLPRSWSLSPSANLTANVRLVRGHPHYPKAALP